jgi:sugar/nucleoside kinase (ribokinase family)
MSLLVVGTIAYDSIETPAGRVTDEIGGSATFFALAASRFTDVRLSGVVGEDFPLARLEKLFHGRKVDFAGVEAVKGGRTFRWSGRYEGDMNAAQTLETQLNVLATFRARLPGEYPKTPFVFLANTAPAVQLEVLEQVEAAGPQSPAGAPGARREKPFVVADTMNFWIETQKDGLLEVLRRVDGIILNDGEARQLTGERNLIRAGTKVLELGPKVVIVKKGEHGAFLFSTYLFHALPAYPVSEVVDPTGAGDTFAGGVMGYLARTGRVSVGTLKRGLVYGTVAASFTVGDFGTRAIAAATREDMEMRVQEFLHFVS